MFNEMLLNRKNNINPGYVPGQREVILSCFIYLHCTAIRKIVDIIIVRIWFEYPYMYRKNCIKHFYPEACRGRKLFWGYYNILCAFTCVCLATCTS